MHRLNGIDPPQIDLKPSFGFGSGVGDGVAEVLAVGIAIDGPFRRPAPGRAGLEDGFAQRHIFQGASRLGHTDVRAKRYAHSALRAGFRTLAKMPS